jgi:hypothetical protein
MPSGVMTQSSLVTFAPDRMACFFPSGRKKRALFHWSTMSHMLTVFRYLELPVCRDVEPPVLSAPHIQSVACGEKKGATNDEIAVDPSLVKIDGAPGIEYFDAQAVCVYPRHQTVWHWDTH